MIKASRIEIRFSESSLHQRHKFDEKNPKVFSGEDCWTFAQGYLFSLAWDGPKTGGYDKTDFAVIFEDGHVYEGRLDIQHPDCEDTDHLLAKHIRQHVIFYSGQVPDNKLPRHITPEQYRKLIVRYDKNAVNYYKEFLEKYEIPV